MHWASSGVEDNAHEDLAAFRAPPELVEALRRQSQESKEFEVWPENWDSLKIFFLVQTQWHAAPMGGLMGLNYQSVEFVFRIHEVKNQRQILDDLQIMELAILSERARKKKET